jgi:hypothetical protein
MEDRLKRQSDRKYLLGLKETALIAARVYKKTGRNIYRDYVKHFHGEIKRLEKDHATR